MIKLRTAMLLFIALIVGFAAGALTVFSGQHPAAAVLAGGAAFGAAVLWLDKVVDR